MARLVPSCVAHPTCDGFMHVCLSSVLCALQHVLAVTWGPACLSDPELRGGALQHSWSSAAAQILPVTHFHFPAACAPDFSESLDHL